MKKRLFSKAQFIKSALEEKDFPTFFLEGKTLMPEMALVGRSNVGKSSLFNALIGQDRVIVSDLPHTTRDIK